ncbi:MAG: PEP/pyruvate-binding domain-containing protein [Kiritimatiellia bacterium]
MKEHDLAEKNGTGSLIQFFGIPQQEPSAFAVSLSLLGGKGVNLCELTRAGFPVPPGFVVTTVAYRRFVEENRLAEKIDELIAQINFRDPNSLEEISARIRALFASGRIPSDVASAIVAAYESLKRSTAAERVAVRSSATAEDLPGASFAGQQDTYLNVHGNERVLDAVKSCWGSLWTARAMGYRWQQDIPKEGLALAVVVQKMVMANAAGVMFTANPVSGARGEIVINAAWGLGEAIVGGKVTPDRIVVDKVSGTIKDVQISEKTVMTAAGTHGTIERELTDELRHRRVLDDAQVGRLAQLGRSIESHYRSPQDIEWCLCGQDFFIVQARPITALPEDPEAVEKYRQSEIERLKKLAAGKRRVWVKHNLNEVLPLPTPLTWDIVGQFMTGNGGFGRMYQMLGYRPSKEVRDEGFLELIGGRIYTDPERAAQLFWEGMPLSYDLDEVVKNPKLMDSAPTRFNPEKADGRFLIGLPRFIRDFRRCSRRTKELSAKVVERFRNEVLPPFLEWLRAKRQQNLSELSTPELLRELEERIERGFNAIGCESLLPGFFGGMASAELEGHLVQLLGEEKGRELGLLLTQGLEGDSTVEQNQALFALARGELTREEFLQRYGHRAVAEMELSHPRWREDDSYLREVLATYMVEGIQAPQQRHDINAAKRRAAEQELPKLLREWGGSSLLEEIVAAMREAQKKLPYREIGKDYLLMGYETVRAVLVELGKRWKLGDDLFFLKLDELKRYEDDPAAFRDVIAERKQAWQCARHLEMADVIDSTNLEKLGLPQEYEHAAVLRGEPVASGISTGNALVIFSPEQAASTCTDYVLVCPSTDPSWTALFVHARGVIVEQGGVLSHGAIVARDFGIPAVVCSGATKRIPNGARIRVDGNRGIITLLDEVPEMADRDQE